MVADLTETGNHVLCARKRYLWPCIWFFEGRIQASVNKTVTQRGTGFSDEAACCAEGCKLSTNFSQVSADIAESCETRAHGFRQLKGDLRNLCRIGSYKPRK
jgi:hypothetical protein